MKMEFLKVKDLKVYFPIREGIIFKKVVNQIKAVDGVSFSINEGETFGLVGESGCGKTSTGRAILNLVKATEGSVWFDGQDITNFSKKQMIPLRQEMQMIFQDPYASLNPRMTVMDIISDPLLEHGLIRKNERRERVTELMGLVGLDSQFMNRYPHEFSGGQRQRIGIARSLALDPRFLVCDEPIASLDVSIQAQIINLLEDLQEKLNLTYLFIAHDLSVVKHISTQVGVMYMGNLVETGAKREIFYNPLHPYTKILMSAIPVPNPLYERNHKRLLMQGEMPSPLNKPKGCAFSTRCPYVMDICRNQAPTLKVVEEGHMVACHLVEEGNHR
jgi:oligopeptide transport system ATP-binding protein